MVIGVRGSILLLPGRERGEIYVELSETELQGRTTERY